MAESDVPDRCLSMLLSPSRWRGWLPGSAGNRSNLGYYAILLDIMLSSGGPGPTHRFKHAHKISQLAIVASMFVPAACGRNGPALGAGPFVQPSGDSTTLSMPVKTDVSATFGEVILGTHHPDLTWTLLGASLVSKPRQMTVVGVGGLAYSKDTTQLGFPPAGMQPLPLLIHGAGSIVLGVAGTATGVYESPGVRVEYEVGTTKYEVIVHTGLRLCVNVPCPHS